MAVLVPCLLAGASGASAATNGSLTVTTLDRNGTSVSAQVEVYNPATGDFRIIDSKKATPLPKGTYELVTAVADAAPSDAETIGGRTVTVSGTTKTTFDARQGRPINVSLSPDPGSGYDHLVVGYVCTTENGPTAMGATATPGHLYVIPSASKAYKLAYGTAYDPVTTSGGDLYMNTATHTGGLPSGVSATLKQSGLTAIHVSARSGPDSGQAWFGFNYSPDDGDGCSIHANGLQFQRTLPNNFTVHVPPGRWEVSQQAHDLIYDYFHNYAAGRTASLTYGHAAWGPMGRLPNTWYHQLYLGTINPFADPSLPTGGVLASGTVKLTHSGKTLYSGTFSPSREIDAHPKIPAAGWYTLALVATRNPSGQLPPGSLSTTSSLYLHFYADPGTNAQVRDYLAHFWPDGLNTRNQAAPGSTTTVVVAPQRAGTDDSTVRQLSDAVKSVHVWYSTDSGSSWHAVTAELAGGKWTVNVHNPASGRVSLRSTITDTHGDDSTTTVYNAYAVS